MSYILEALKKSDRERQQNSVPTLQTHHAQPPGSRSLQKTSGRKKRFLFATFFSILFITLCALVMRERFPFFLSLDVTLNSAEPDAATVTKKENQVAHSQPAAIEKEEEIVNTTAESEVSPGLETVSKPPPAHLRSEQTKVTYQPAPLLPIGSTDKQTLTATAKGENQGDNQQPVEKWPFLEDMPQDLQEKFPQLKFAGHTYSESRDRRMIIINNSIRKEGDLIDSGLKLEEITWDGVVLNYHGNRFQVITTR